MLEDEPGRVLGHHRQRNAVNLTQEMSDHLQGRSQVYGLATLASHPSVGISHSLLSQVALGPTDEVAAGGPEAIAALVQKQVGEPEQSLELGIS